MCILDGADARSNARSALAVLAFSFGTLSLRAAAAARRAPSGICTALAPAAGAAAGRRENTPPCVVSALRPCGADSIPAAVVVVLLVLAVAVIPQRAARGRAGGSALTAEAAVRACLQHRALHSAHVSARPPRVRSAPQPRASAAARRFAFRSPFPRLVPSVSVVAVRVAAQETE